METRKRETELALALKKCYTDLLVQPHLQAKRVRGTSFLHPVLIEILRNV